MPGDAAIHNPLTKEWIAVQGNHTSAAETWLPIPDFPGYLASDLGRIASDRRATRRVLSPATNNCGYQYVCPVQGGKRVHKLVHRLVAATFIGPCPEGMEVRHRNGIQADCTPSNLCYGTKSQNILDQVEHGTHAMAAKTACRQGHPFDAANTYRPPGGRGRGRACRTCRRQWRVVGEVAA